ncbi:MAG: polyphosphate kinase 1 [Saprospiraceae bacterium]|nr:polyphosphate kinase 1 [Saprospiraceae bacterium]
MSDPIFNQESLETTVRQEYIDRDISWLHFNYRVLQEAKDADVPLLERLKFLAIYSSNLGEFFRIRVAHHKNLAKLGKNTKSHLDYNPKLMLKQLYKIANNQLTEFNNIFDNQIIPELKNHSIYLLSHIEISEAQQQFVENYFNENLLPFVQPVLLIEQKVKPFLANSELYLTVMLKDKSLLTQELHYAVVKIPSDHLPRFIELPCEKDRHDVILLDEIVRASLKWLFPGFDIIDSYSIKLTRDAELYIEDEFSGDLLEKIKKSLIKRNIGPASRLVYDNSMPKEMLAFLLRLLEIDKDDLTPEGRYHNNFDFLNFPDFGKKELKNKTLRPIDYRGLAKGSNIFDNISKSEHLLCFPYHNYEPVIQLFEQAAKDPDVTSIKITQYRVARKSRIMDALKLAASEGKSVFVFIEVKARFDEANNLAWGEELEKMGVKVRYSFPGLKVHSKTALITRKENDTLEHYAYLSTGNFHELTSRIYVDYGFFTKDESLTSEISRFFSFLENIKLPNVGFKHLLVGQFNLNDEIHSLIEFEKNQARLGKKAQIILKLNNLQDYEIMDMLYKASESGVEIKLVIRGICGMIIGKKGLSENIEGIAIIDRFLEHSRIYYFYHGGEEKLFLSSADWMARNLHFRIETAFPIYNSRFKKIILDNIDYQLRDNVKARTLHYETLNAYIRQEGKRKFQSQLETHKYFKELNEQQYGK